MNRRTWTRWLPVALLLLISSAHAELSCDDFLANAGGKPAYLEFLECHQEPELQGAPFRATYRLPGREVYNAERYAAERFSMKPLRRSCCIWDAPPGFFRDPHTGIGYSVFMGSGETPVNRRESLQDIDFIYLRVDAYAEDP